MIKLRNFLIIIILGLLLASAVCGGLALWSKNNSVYDFSFTSFSHRNLNDFYVSFLNDGDTIIQPFAADGKELNTFHFFIRYSTPPICKNGAINLDLMDTDGNIVTTASLDCKGIPDKDWFGWNYDFNTPLIQGNLYSVRLRAAGTADNTFELRTIDSNEGRAAHFPDMSYNNIVQKGSILVTALSFTKEMTGYIPECYQSILKVLALCAAILLLELLMLTLFIDRKQKAFRCLPPVTIGVIAVMIPMLSGICFYYGTRPWYASKPPVAHALGAVDGNTYTNSKEAFEQSLERGFICMEVDFSTTSDGYIVLRHDWGKSDGGMGFPGGYVLTLQEFQEHLIADKYTSLSLLDLFVLLEQNPSVYIITDSKEGDYDTVVKQFSKLVETASENGYESILNRFVIQLYNDDMLQAVESVHHFDHYIYTLYQRGTDDIEQLIDFCRQHNISVVTIFDLWWYEQPDFREKMLESGLTIYLHTVNDLETILELRENGVANVYTDHAAPCYFRQ